MGEAEAWDGWGEARAVAAALSSARRCLSASRRVMKSLIARDAEPLVKRAGFALL